MIEGLHTGDSARLERRQQLKTIGVERLSLPEMKAVGATFGQHIRAGLEKRPSSLATIPTLLQPVDLANIPQDKHALVIEIGGTNTYGGVIGVENGEVQLTQSVEQPLPPKRTYASSDEFFTSVAANVAPLLHEQIDTLGIIWSFPTEKVMTTPNGIDALSESVLPKELVIPDIEKIPVGDQLLRALREYNQAIPANLSRVVANDTAAVLLANGGNLGGIVGTGFNLAFSHDGHMYNLEAGGFDGVVQTSLTRQIDAESERSGHYLAEKQTSGGYVGKLFSAALQQLDIQRPEVTSKEISKLLDRGEMADVPEESLPLLREMAEIIRDRSAQNVAAMIVGTMQEFPEDFTDEKVTIPIEGSFFGKTPGYREAVAQYILELLPEKPITLLAVAQSGIKGAGVAALGLVQ